MTWLIRFELQPQLKDHILLIFSHFSYLEKKKKKAVCVRGILNDLCPYRAARRVEAQAQAAMAFCCSLPQAAGTFPGYKANILKVFKSIEKGLDGPPRLVSYNYR